MPLEVGRGWLYLAKVSFQSYVMPLKVTRELSVAHVRGVELSSRLGVSRLAWAHGGLFADSLCGTQFVPALPLVYSTEETYERPWKGRVMFVDKGSLDVAARPATATQSQRADDDLTFRGKKIHCVRSTIRLQTAVHRIEVITWFSSGLGIVQQEQRTDDELLVRLTLLDDKQA